MKPFIIILLCVTIFLLCKFETVEGQNKQKWLEIGKELFFIEPEGNYTWKQAVAECKKKHSNLIHPKGDYDYAKLKDVIKHNFKNYSSFWANSQVKWTSLFHQIGLSRNQYNRQKCYKFDNSSMFRFLPETCDNQLGFICEKSLLKSYSSFNAKNMVYFVQPDQQFTCEQAYDQCEKRHMSLLVLKDHANNKLLKNYIFINYGSSPSFWFSYNNETHYNCATPKRGHHIQFNSKLGFICQIAKLRSPGLSMRHIILLTVVALAAFLAIILFVLKKCFYSNEDENFNLSEEYSTDGVKVTEIK